MKTYQDLIAVGASEQARMDFVHQVINEHKGGTLYRTAQIADDYDRQMNTTICAFRRVLYNLQGRPVDDLWSANYKLASNFFRRFVTQQNQFLLGNGVQWNEDSTGERLGKDFDTKLQIAGRAALIGAVSYGFWNNDHLEVFKVTEFAPLLDEENGALRAGVRFWQIDASKPLRATLYEEDGLTEYLWEKGEGKILKQKQRYQATVASTAAEGTTILEWKNYPGFPIVPFWANPHHQSELLGIRSQIDAYDIIKSGFADDLDTAQLYWILHNTGGMDDTDLAQFIERLHIVHAAAVDDVAGTAVDAHTVEIPHEAREKLLDRIEKDLYKDFMALNTEAIAGGAATATQIRAAYEPMNSKADEYEYCVIEFINGILAIAGIDDEPSFTRSMMINVQEEVQTISQAAMYLPEEYVTTKIVTLLGDADQVENILAQNAAEETKRFTNVNTPEEEETPEDANLSGDRG